MLRYSIKYRLKKDGKWEEVGAKTLSEANALYDMVGDEANFKVLIDNVSWEQLRQHK